MMAALTLGDDHTGDPQPFVHTEDFEDMDITTHQGSTAPSLYEDTAAVPSVEPSGTIGSTPLPVGPSSGHGTPSAPIGGPYGGRLIHRFPPLSGDSRDSNTSHPTAIPTATNQSSQHLL